MTSRSRWWWITVLVGLGLLFYLAAFGEGLTPRPEGYEPVDYLMASCQGTETDTTAFRFGVEGDVRWIEIYVEDSPKHAQLAGVAAYAPGVDGVLLFAEVLLPSGQVLRFQSAEALRNSPYVDICMVTAAWRNRI